MAKVIDFNEHKEEHTAHIVKEVMCVKCLHRWIAVIPSGVLLKDLECPQCICNKVGYVIETGQEFKELTENE